MFILILASALASASCFSQPFRNCTDEDFICENFECVPASRRCDGVENCSDFSDERDCDEYHCLKPLYFRCKNHRCISSSFVCDEENDCEDFSDEKDCDTYKHDPGVNSTCEKNFWQCTDKLCIPADWVCNGESDCLDGSDEILGCSVNITCNDFKCKNGHCIPLEWRCDGMDDCRDNSDELNCESVKDPKECTIAKHRFLCKDGKTCISLEHVCDGNSHCLDKSDEGGSCNQTCSSCANSCIKLPTGPTCVCSQGYRTSSRGTCEDIDECQNYGVCAQQCENLPGSYRCQCDQGYSLAADKTSCKAHFGDALLFFATKEEIRSYSLTTEIYMPIVKNLRQVVGVDYDGTHVYWSEVFDQHESIFRSANNKKGKELLVTSGLGSPEDIAIDHITGNVYFTDAERQHIGVCNTDATHCTVLVNQDIHKPRGIALHPHKGEMFWTDWGDKPEIGRALMDGTNDTSFVSINIHWPNDVTIDYPNSRLYWTDAKFMTIESIKLDGSDRRVILSGVVKHPYAIAVFENKLYWSDWETHSIQSCDKFTGKNHHTLIKEKKELIYGISIYHRSHRRKHRNPCESAFCSDICLLKGAGYACACPEEKELGTDGHVCVHLEKRQRLVLAADNILLQIDHQRLGKHEETILPLSAKQIGALTYNSIQNTLYISDIGTKKILALDLHSGTSESLIIGDLGTVVAMDFDYLGNNLYWCDAQRKTVEVFSLNSKERKILLHDIDGETPEAIALVPEEGIMFVAFQKLKPEAHVDRIFMDGTSRSHPVEHELVGPIVLFYDHDLQRVFIADERHEIIQTISTDGDERHEFRVLGEAPTGLAALKRELFWIAKNSKRLFWTDKHNFKDATKKIALDLPSRVSSMIIASITPRKIGYSPCQQNNGNCSHLCLHSHLSVVCACPSGMKLDDDHRTCVKPTECSFEQFHCRHSNLCIDKKLRCDGTQHCPSGEDEVACVSAPKCSAEEFRCQTGACIKTSQRCDKKIDCADRSDEYNCNQLCPPGQFRCNSGQCINERFVCDGVTDCFEKEDEMNCMSTVCTASQFRCASGSCIPKPWECDQTYDCVDMSDEHEGCHSCPASAFTCGNKKCLDMGFVCNNEDDCGDNSDEMSCQHTASGCLKEEFACTGHRHICLPQSAVCNGTSECPHHEDERNCTSCHIDEFSCANKKCVPTQWICDRSDDCGDGSDEDPSLCDQKEAPKQLAQACHGSFQCKSGNCIDLGLVCNGKQDCFDGSDEGGLCKTSCSGFNNPCGQICVSTPSGAKCGCEDGFLLQGDGQHCQDINECEKFPVVCSQACHNTPGGHICDCMPGFVIKNDKISCKAEGAPMALLFTNENQIRMFSQASNSLSLIKTEDASPLITGLAVSAKTGAIVYSIKELGTIFMIHNATAREYIEGVGKPRHLALDWITDNIYYVNDDTKSSINVCSFKDKTCSTLLTADFKRQVTALAVDAVNKHLFYSLVTWGIFHPSSFVIYKTNLDGSAPQELVKSTIGYVTGLAFDIYKKELYFADQYNSQLWVVDYEGVAKQTVARNITKVSGLELFENSLYFLSAGGFMGKCRIFAPTSCHYFRISNHHNHLFAMKQASIQPELGTNPCRGHSCEHLCLPNQVTHRCLCPGGKTIEPGERCDDVGKEGAAVRLLAVHHIDSSDSGGHKGAVIASVTLAVCCLSALAALLYVRKRRNSGHGNISLRFHNPAYGVLQISENASKPVLQPGQHEYDNPIHLEESTREHDPEETLLNVQSFT